MRLIFIGPPGAGKGTQTKKIADKYNICIISSGEILRQNRQRGTALGLEAAEYVDRGDLAPDDIIITMIKDEINHPKACDGYMLDGFPRTVRQAEALDEALKENNTELDAALVLEIPDKIIIDRLTARRTCSRCGAVYNLQLNPPKITNVCDVCAGSLYQRQDDNEETVTNRMKVYKEKTSPVIDYYKKSGRAIFIDGTGEVNEVFEKITKELSKVKKA